MRDTSAHRRSLPALGKRGEGWVLLQVVLIATVFLCALSGHGWSGTARVVAYAGGGTLLALGLWMLVTGAVKLGGYGAYRCATPHRLVPFIY